MRHLKRREQFIRRQRWLQPLLLLIPKASGSKSIVSTNPRNPFLSPLSMVSLAPARSPLFSLKLQGILNSQHISGCAPHCSSCLPSLSADDLKASAVSVECVVEAFSHLKCGKSDSGSLISDRLIHALPAISSSLSSLFTAIPRHGFMLGIASLVPPKRQ